MLPRGRASLLNAPDVSQRVCNEAAPKSGHVAVKRGLPTRLSSLSWSRAMHNTPPCPVPAGSPSSKQTWERGRPATFRSSIARSIHQSLVVREQTLPGQSIQSSTVTLLGSQAHTPPASTAQAMQPSEIQDTKSAITQGVQRKQLWDPSMAIRFASTTCLEEDISTLATITPRRRPQPGAEVSGTAKCYSTNSPTVSVECELEKDLDYKNTEGHSSMEGDTYLSTNSSSQERTTNRSSEDPEHSACYYHDSIPEQESRDIHQEDMVGHHAALTYQIPEDALRTAMMASPNTRASFWSAKLYRGPEGENLLIHYCQSMEVAERVAQYFLKEEVVGFDIEWKPRGNPLSIKQNASLIQLACENRIALFHISLFSGTKAEQLMPPSLKKVLESPDIYKVGVAAKGDFSRLEKFLGIQAQGVYELSRLHNLVQWYETDPSKVSKKLVSLAAQVLQHLQLPLYKGEPLDDEPSDTESVRESDWSQPLSLEQIHYAAADAYAGFRLYHVLELKRKQLTPVPPAIQLCDYDSKPKPKSNEPRKRAKSAIKPEAVVEIATENVADPIDQEIDESEDTEDLNDSESAPDEFLDSHQLEDPRSSPLSKVSVNLEENTELRNELDRDMIVTPKHVGRVNLSQLRGPDPGYPTLPQIPDEDDEFTDPELEEALRAMEIDDDGNLREDPKTATADMAIEREGQMTPTLSLPALSQKNLESHNARLASTQPTTATPTTPSTPTFKPLIPLSQQVLHTPEYNLATTWAQTYLQSTLPSPLSTTPPRIRATIPHLRAYYLWHHLGFSVADTATHLHDPPLARTTVTTYIAQAISLENLDYEKQALRTLIVAHMSPAMRKGRWKWLAEKVGALD